MKNGPSENEKNKLNAIQFIYERLPPARLNINNNQPLPHNNTLVTSSECQKFFLCKFVESDWKPIAQNALMPTNTKSKCPYRSELIIFSNKRWSVLTFDNNDEHQNEKKKLKSQYTNR